MVIRSYYRCRMSLLSVVTLFTLCLLPVGFAAQPPQPKVGAPYLMALVVPDLDPAVAWYQKHLGFQVQEKLAFPQVRIAFLVAGTFRLEIVEDKRAFSLKKLEQLVPEIKGLDNPLDGFAKIAFSTPQFDAVADRLKQDGVQFQTGIMKASGNWPRSFIVLDNNGNWVQFVDSGTTPSK